MDLDLAAPAADIIAAVNAVCAAYRIRHVDLARIAGFHPSRVHRMLTTQATSQRRRVTTDHDTLVALCRAARILWATPGGVENVNFSKVDDPYDKFGITINP